LIKKLNVIFIRSASPRPKQEVVFHLNEVLAKTTKSGEKEEKIPLEHKFVMTPLGSQAVYILKQSEENSKGKILMKLNFTSFICFIQLIFQFLERKRFPLFVPKPYYVPDHLHERFRVF
jgi:hypothetical protein